ncbi:DUF2752 domain-containing protein [uncultured Victivallis sp.]|uniref:DUF2752 domain-containing protein n=1 Tax=uncultured Victivallis sp. TaxID=354118 RepID=UPI0025F3C3DB|nr:DUF2752 domain-containing protein [uncultured Victivallis sp.]
MRKFSWYVIMVTVAAAAVIILVLLYAKGPDWFWFPPCIFHLITHLYCPGCGSTRAVYRLLHGDVAGSLSANILLIPSVLLFLAVIRKGIAMIKPREYYGIMGVYLFYLIARNIPLEPLSYLAPR